MADKPAPESSKLTDLKRRLDREPSPRLHVELAKEYLEAGLFEEAAQACAKAVKVYPSFLSARVLLGKIHFDMGDVKRAREEMETVLGQAPDNLTARRVLAEISFEEGDLQGALDRYRALLAFSPTDKETGERIAALEKSLQQEVVAPPGPPAEPAVSESLEAPRAALQQETGPAPTPPAQPAASESLEAPRAALQKEAGPPPTPPAETGLLATPTLAEIYLQQGLDQKAADVYREILKGDPGNSEAQVRLSELEAAARSAPDPDAEARARKIELLNSWLESIRGGARV